MTRGRAAPKPGEACPCGAGLFARCCAPLLARTASADSARQLMRSRYTAYVLGDAAYLLDSWHPETRPRALDLAAGPERWIGLTIRAARPLSPTTAEVEFIARYRVGGRARRLHETSRFECLDGRWYYRDGILHEG